MLSELQKRKLTRKFRVFDTDRDGFLTRADFEQAAVNLAGLLPQSAASSNAVEARARYLEMWDAVQKFCDSDRDGRVTVAEWLEYHDLALTHEAEMRAAVPGYRGGVETLAAFLFDLFDADRDGHLSSKEYEQFCAVYHIDDVKPQDVFNRLDGDGDGMVSAEQLLRLVREFYFGQDADAPGNWLYGPYTEELRALPAD